MDADDIVSEVNGRFEDVAGFRFHEDVRATIIFGQLVKEHGQAKVLRAFDVFLEEFPNPFEAETALHEFTTNFKRYLKRIGWRRLPHGETLLAKHPFGIIRSHEKLRVLR